MYKCAFVLVKNRETGSNVAKNLIVLAECLGQLEYFQSVRTFKPQGKCVSHRYTWISAI